MWETCRCLLPTALGNPFFSNIAPGWSWKYILNESIRRIWTYCQVLYCRVVEPPCTAPTVPEAYCVIFTAELILRLVAYRLEFFTQAWEQLFTDIYMPLYFVSTYRNTSKHASKHPERRPTSWSTMWFIVAFKRVGSGTGRIQHVWEQWVEFVLSCLV